jgi:hypothetical protein
VTRWLLALALALVVGPAVAQVIPESAAVGPTVPMTIAEYGGDTHDDPLFAVITDGSGQARVGMAAGHGGIMFETIDGQGFLVIEDGGDAVRLGRQEVILDLMATDEGEWRRLALGLGRQEIEIAPRGMETIAGVTGQVYAITMIEAGRRSAPLEVVISADPRLAATGREILRIYDLARAPLIGIHGREPQPYVAFRTLLARGTPIRIGPHYRLRELTVRDVPPGSLIRQGPILDRPAFVAVLREQLMREPGNDGRSAADRAAAADPNFYNDAMMDSEYLNEPMTAQVANAVAMAASDAANAAMAAYPSNEPEADNAANPD